MVEIRRLNRGAIEFEVKTEYYIIIIIIFVREQAIYLLIQRQFGSLYFPKSNTITFIFHYLSLSRWIYPPTQKQLTIFFENNLQHRGQMTSAFLLDFLINPYPFHTVSTFLYPYSPSVKVSKKNILQKCITFVTYCEVRM